MLEEYPLRLLDQVGAALRARIIERGDEIGDGRAFEPLQDRLARGQQVGQRNAAEIVADQGPGRGRSGLEGGDAGMRYDVDAAGHGRHGAIALGIEQFVGKRRHGVDLRVARADQRHHLALGSQFERVTDAGLLLAEFVAMPGLAAPQVPYKVEVEAVADPVGAILQRRHGRRGALWRFARSDADQVQHAGAAPERRHVDRSRGAADGAGGARRFQLLDHQRSGLQGRSLGNRRRADGVLDIVRGLLEAIALLRQFGGREQAERHLEVARRGVQRRLIGLDVDRGDGGERQRRKVLRTQRRLDQPDHLGAVGMALAADPGHQRLRMVDDAALDPLDRFGDQHLDRPRR